MTHYFLLPQGWNNSLHFSRIWRSVALGEQLSKTAAHICFFFFFLFFLELENSLVIIHQNPLENLRSLPGQTISPLLLHYVLHIRALQVKSFWLFGLLKTRCKKHLKSWQFQASEWNHQSSLGEVFSLRGVPCPENAEGMDLSSSNEPRDS